MFITIPVTCLSVALLLPASTARLFLTPLTRFTRSHPLVISQVFMTGFAAGVIIDSNVSVIIESTARRLLYLGRDVTFSYHIEFMNTSWDPYNPAMGLILGVRYALVVCALLIISGAITSVLLQVTESKTLYTHPALTLLLLPATYALSLYLLVSAGYLAAALILVAAGMALLRAAVPVDAHEEHPVPRDHDPAHGDHCGSRTCSLYSGGFACRRCS